MAALTDIILKERGCARRTAAPITLTEGGRVMEFNVFEYFKDYKRTANGPMTPEEQGTSFFLGGPMGPQIRHHAEPYADKAGVSRRNFFGTTAGFAATMLAVNKITGMQFFEVSEAEAADLAAAKEIMISRKSGSDFIVDAHTHICTRKDGYIPGVNTTEKGMWFVQLLDDLGKNMGLPNGTKDMTVENFGKLILEGSDTSVAIFNPFGFREDFDAAADDFLDLNFIAYHSAWPYQNELAALKGFKPQRKNLYSEVGSTFAATVTSRPIECAHVLGTLLRDLGPDYVMWGTDSC